MPIYEYRCLKCGKHFERLIFNGQDEPDRCPFCGGPINKLLSTGVGFIFKGSGFYATDYKKRKEKRSRSEEDSEKGTSESESKD